MPQDLGQKGRKVLVKIRRKKLKKHRKPAAKTREKHRIAAWTAAQSTPAGRMRSQKNCFLNKTTFWTACETAKHHGTEVRNEFQQQAATRLNVPSGSPREKVRIAAWTAAEAHLPDGKTPSIYLIESNLILSYLFLFLSYLILSYPFLSYLILSYPILPYPILSYSILFYPILSYLILSDLIWSYLIWSYLILSDLILSILIYSYLILSILIYSYLFLSILTNSYLSVCLSIYLSIDRSIYRSIDLSIYSNPIQSNPI